MKGLNKSGDGKNRFKFNKKAVRVKHVNVDVLHQTRLPDTLDTATALPETGLRGCHFQDQLERNKNLDSSGEFARFYYDMWPLVQSMPELIHHLPKVVSRLSHELLQVPTATLPSFLSLVAVLARDMQEDLFSYLDVLLSPLVTLSGRITNAGSERPHAQSLDPEATGKIFECFSHVLRFLWKPIISNPNCIRKYYGPLLGHSTPFVREFAAKSFPVILRRISRKHLKSHWNKILSAVVSNFTRFYATDAHLSGLQVPTGSNDVAAVRDVPKRLRDLLDGIVLLVFNCCKGVKGCLHSFADLILPVVLDSFGLSLNEASTPTTESVNEKKIKQNASLEPLLKNQLTTLAETSKNATISHSWVSGYIVWKTMELLFRHLRPINLTSLWTLGLTFISRTMNTVRLFAGKDAFDVCHSVGVDFDAIEKSLNFSVLYILEFLIFGISHSSGRGINYMKSKEDKIVLRSIISQCFSLCNVLWDPILSHTGVVTNSVISRSACLLCEVWEAHPRDSKVLERASQSLMLILGPNTSASPGTVQTCLSAIAAQLLPTLPADILESHLMQLVTNAIALLQSSAAGSDDLNIEWMTILLKTQYAIYDVRGTVTPSSSHFSQQVRSGDDATAVSTRINPGVSESDGESEDNASCESNESCGIENEGIDPLVYRYPTDGLIYLLDNEFAAKSLLCSSGKGLEGLASACVDLLLQCLGNTRGGNLDVLLLVTACLRWFAICRKDIFLNDKILQKKMIKVLPYVSSLASSVSDEATSENRENIFVFSHILHLVCQVQLSCTVFKDEAVLTSAMHAAFEKLSSCPCSISLLWAALTALHYAAADSPNKGKITLPKLVSGQDKLALLSSVARALAVGSYWMRILALRVICIVTAGDVAPSTGALSELSCDAKTSEMLPKSDFEVASLCLDAASMAASLASEREYARRVGSLEAWIRLGLLSESMLAVVCNFCLGMLDYKFKPFWEPAVATLIAAVDFCASSDQDLVWGLILDVLVKKSYEGPAVIADTTGTLQTRHAIRLLGCDSGVEFIPVDVAIAPIFPFLYEDESRKVQHAGDLRVDLDSRTDYNTAYVTLWSVFRRCPKLTMQRSKIVVPIFLSFLRLQFYARFCDELEFPDLLRLGVLTTHPILDGQTVQTSTAPDLPPYILKKRLEMFLQVFAAIPSPKQLFQHQLLYSLFHVLVAKSEPSISKLALDCILSFKTPAYASFVDVYKGLMDDSKIRKELITFNVTPESGGIDKAVRPEVLNLTIRILYGKFSAKIRGGRAARDQSLSCRTAILTFLSVLPREELVQFFYFIFRGILPKLSLLKAARADFVNTVSVAKADSRDAKIGDWFQTITGLVNSLTATDICAVVAERQVGFLNMFEHLLRVLGHAVLDHIDNFGQMLILFISSSSEVREAVVEDRQTEEPTSDSEDDEDSVERENSFKVKKQMSDCLKIRKLCILRLSEMVHQFHKKCSFGFFRRDGSIWTILRPLVDVLPSALASGAKPPALLKLVNALCKYPETIGHVVADDSVVISIIQCTSRKSDMDTARAVIESMTGLLDYQGGAVLRPHVELIIESFAKKFAGDDINVRVQQLKLSQLHIYVTGHIQLELHLLCRISEELLSSPDVIIESNCVTNFSTLLLGMIRTYSMSKKVRVEEDWLLSVLKVYKALIRRMDDVSHHVNFISRLFGPSSHSFSLFNAHTVRSLLCETYADLAAHPSTRGLLTSSSVAIANLTAFDKTLMGGRDYSLCMPVFQALCAKSSVEYSLSWSSLMGPSNCDNEARSGSMCVVVMYEILRCMHDEEQALRGAALACLKQLAEDGFSWAYISTDNINWLDNIKSGLLPAIHFGLQHGSDSVKKGFVQLLAHVVKVVNTLIENGVFIREEERIAFHSDLGVLTHMDPEQDFFENISHMQIHRRVKAMTKVRSVFENGTSIATSSAVHVLVPIALHPLGSDEFLKKDHLMLLQEAAQLLGTLSGHLPWTHYYGTVKRVLKLLDNLRTDKEKILLNALCNVLENFPFDLNVKDIRVKEGSIIVADCRDGIEIEPEDKDLDEDGEDIAENDFNHGDRTDDKIEQDGLSSKEKIIGIIMKSLMPWIRAYLFKEETNPKGVKVKVVRSQVAVALTKLIRRLNPPLVTQEQKNTLFSNLVINVISTLKGPDVTARDLARESLAKMVQAMGMEYLYTVLNELKHMLKEGYQRHVRNYTVRAVLSTVLEKYTPPADAESMLTRAQSDLDPITPDFDKCIPILMECVMDDLVGRTHDDMTHDGKVKSQIREQKGNKANDILELVSRCILFRPSYALRSINNPSSVSSIHAIVIPLVECLTSADEDEVEADFLKKGFAIEQDGMKNRIGRISEALKSVAYGVAKNPSVLPKELLLYLHATLQPFIINIIRDLNEQKRLRGKVVSENETDAALIKSFENEINSRLPSYFMDELSDDEEFGVITQESARKKAKTDSNGVSTFRPSVWLPFENKHAKNQGKAVADRIVDQKSHLAVLDGAHAPKRTGYGVKAAHKRGRDGGATATDPAVLAAVKFCLTLLGSSIKHNVVNGAENEEVRAMAVPFLPLLGQCLSLPGAVSVATLALRSLCSMLSWGVEVDSVFSRLIATKILRTIVAGGALISVDNELIQGYLKGLTSLFALFNEHKKVKQAERRESTSALNMYDEEGNMDPVSSAGVVAELPLSMEDIRSLVSMLTVAVMEANGSYQSSTFQLIKTIIETRVVIPEIYDLVTKLTDQIVLSHRKGVRESCSSAVVSFMMNFPVGNKRLMSHLKQLITNCTYEYETGRLSAMSVLHTIVKLFPAPVLQDISTMVFFPMVQASVSDLSPTCRQSAAEVILSLCRRIDSDSFNSFQEYAAQWMSAGATTATHLPDIETRMLLKTGCLVGGITVAARPDLCKKGSRVQEWVKILASRLEQLLKICYSGKVGEETNLISLGESEGVGDDGGSTDWAVLYHILILLEKMYVNIPSVTDSAMRNVSCSALDIFGSSSASLLLLEVIQEAMLFPHAWVRMASCRIIQNYCERRDPTRGKSGLITSSEKGEFLTKKGGLFGLGRKLCVVLNMPVLPAGLLASATSTLVFVITALISTVGVIENLVERRVRKPDGDEHPSKKTKLLDEVESDKSGDSSDDHSHDDDEDSAASDSVEEETLDDVASNTVEGSHWIMQRLRGLGVDSRGNRRLHVLQVFYLLLKKQLPHEFYIKYAKVIIEVAMRTRLHRDGVTDTEEEKTAKNQASEILEALEELVGSSAFIGLYAEVQRFVQHQKNTRKRSRAADAVRDPRAHAERKVLNAQRKKFAKKMKNARLAATKGGKRRQHPSGSGKKRPQKEY